MLFGLKMSSWGIFSQTFISLSHSYFLLFWIPLDMKRYHQELKKHLLIKGNTNLLHTFIR